MIKLGNIMILMSLMASVACKNIENTKEAAVEQDSISFNAEAITSGPKYHWFGYYDKLQTDPSGRYVLSMEVDFEGRSPKADDTLRVGMIDTENNNEWIELGKSVAWGWQQGCMLQFVPGTNNLVIWNDRQDDKFVSHLVNIETGEKKTLPFPIYTLSPDGKTALSVDFERINDLRPGYGYAGIADPNKEELAPKNAGIYRCDLETANKELIVSLDQMMDMTIPVESDTSVQEYKNNKHWFNHLLVNPDGTRFIFLHRWKAPSKKNVGGFGTLMYTANLDGSDLRLVDPSGYTSHFIWKNVDQICAWTKPIGKEFGFYLFDDVEGGDPQIVGKEEMTVNGHNTYVPRTDNVWILNDTYPNKDRNQTLYLYNTETDEKIVLGKFHSPTEYKGEWRCDLHPKATPDGKKVIFDSTHGGEGRQVYVVDIESAIQ